MEEETITSLEFLSADIHDILYWLLFVLSSIVAIFLSYILQWILYYVFSCLCGECIRHNDSLRYEPRRQHDSYNPNPFNCSGLTTSRVYSIHLIVSWIILILLVSSILLFFQFRMTFLGALSGGGIVFLWGFIGHSEWIWSFILRFFLLYDDHFRVGDLIVLESRLIGRIVKMWAAGVIIQIVPRNCMTDAFERNEEARLRKNTGVKVVGKDDHIDTMNGMLECIINANEDTVIEKSVTYTTLMNHMKSSIIRSKRRMTTTSRSSRRKRKIFQS